MDAIVLAGGFGTRLAHVVSDVPKPMAPVCGRPFLQYILDDLQAKGIDRIILAVGYKQEVIRSFFGSSYRGMEVLYSCEDTPLFTGGAIKQALPMCRGDGVLILNGDTYFDVDVTKLVEAGKIFPNYLVMATKRMHNFDRYGTLILNGCFVLAFQEKSPHQEGHINGGVYWMPRTYLDSISERKFSFETDVLEPQAKAGTVVSVESDGYFIDIGVPEDYAKAQEDFAQIPRTSKAVFFDRDGTINVDVHYLHRPEQLKFISGMPEFIRKWNDWGYRVIVVTNQAGIARGYYKEEQMRTLHHFMNEQLRKVGAHIDAFYFCPHHPDITGHCHCRKPEPGMIEAAIREFELDAKQCLLFGDKPWDVETACRCGIFGVLTN